MKTPIDLLPDSVALQYSELLRHAVRPAPDGANLSFKTKSVRGRRYLYLQVSIGRRRTEHYLGPETPELLARLERERELWRLGDEDRRTRARLVAMLLAGGAGGLAAGEGTVLALLERGGVFLAGGVLVGTFAFRAYANMLGVRWDSELSTRDIDIATDDRLTVAVDSMSAGPDLSTLLMESGMGFIKVPSLDRKAPTTEFSLRGRELSVELLTPLRGPPRGEPVRVSSLNAWAEPLRFIDYLLDDVQIAVLLFKHGIVVNVPAPARFALHKLVVSRRRPVAFAEKSRRDVAQAEQVCRVLLQLRPGDLILAHDASSAMGEKFRSQLRAGIDAMGTEVAGEVHELLGTDRSS